MIDTSEIIVVSKNVICQYYDVVQIPHKGETVIPTNPRYEQDSGKGVNCAIAIGRLGGSVSYIGKVGNDNGGSLNEKWLRDAHVHLDHFIIQDETTTTQRMILLAENQEKLIFEFYSTESDITLDEAKMKLEQIRGAKHLILDFELSLNVVLGCAQLGKKMGLQVYLKPGPNLYDFDSFDMQFVDVLFVNEMEALSMMGLTGQNVTDGIDVARSFVEKYGLASAIITLGERGSFAWSGEEGWEVSGCKDNLFDQFTAEDMFMAATIQNLARGKTLREATEYAQEYCANKSSK